ncbi:ParH-like protein [Kitasatospora sp. NPDC058184]|uniref:ParH-like protein n=1 Tax=Kitasatospora sp. NPDC058184 TaxID=3346370 RepID=UPI0036DB2779
MRWIRRHGGLMRRCRAISESLDLPDPFDAAELVARLARARGRPIDLIAVPARPGAPCGLLVTTGQADYIVYAEDTSEVHRQHILVHEYAHLLLGHADGPSPDPGLTHGLLPHLSPTLVGKVLGRTVYLEPQEREAELLASLILKRALLPGGRAANAQSRDAEWAQRLSPLLGRRRPTGPHD